MFQNETLVRHIVYLKTTSLTQNVQRRMTNWNGYNRKRSWPSMRYYLVISMDATNKTFENIRTADFQVELLHPGPPKYEACTQTVLMASYVKFCNTSLSEYLV